MGGANEKQRPEAQRRRLSVAHTEAETESLSKVEIEEVRGLISSLSEQTIIQLADDCQAQPKTGRRMSIGSVTDKGTTSFANKTLEQLGDEVDPTDEGIGYTCRKGLKPEAPNQDSWFVLKLEQVSIYGVFDGHGQAGHDASNFVKENLPKLILKDKRFRTPEMPQMLKDVFIQTQNLIYAADHYKKLSAQLSGTTATICIHDHAENKITTAHCGDSTCVVGQEDQDGQFKGQVLTRDHKPSLPDERKRIEEAGGRVVFDGYANHRIYSKNARYPGLNMSRCIGDLMGQTCGITAEPEVTERTLTAEDSHLLLCSDGVWEFIDADEAVGMISEFPADKAMAAAGKLAKAAWDRWIREEGGNVVDDITVLAIYLKRPAPSDKPAKPVAPS